MKYKILLLSLVIPILLSAQTRRLWVDSLFVRGSAGDYRKVSLAETFGDTSLTGLDSVGVYAAVNSWNVQNTSWYTQLSSISAGSRLAIDDTFTVNGRDTLESMFLESTGGGYFSQNGSNDTLYINNCFIGDDNTQYFDSNLVVVGNILNDEIRPEWWGISADTTADCSKAIERAIYFASYRNNNGYRVGRGPFKVKLGTGTYLCNSDINIYSGVGYPGEYLAIEGNNKENTIIRFVGDHGFRISQSSGGVRFRDFEVQSDQSTHTAEAAFLVDSLSQFIEWQDISIKEQFANGIKAISSYQCFVDHCFIYADTAINLRDPSGYVGELSEQWRITNNFISSRNGTYPSCAFYFSEAAWITIKKNHINYIRTGSRDNAAIKVRSVYVFNFIDNMVESCDSLMFDFDAENGSYEKWCEVINIKNNWLKTQVVPNDSMDWIRAGLVNNLNFEGNAVSLYKTTTLIRSTKDSLRTAIVIGNSNYANPYYNQDSGNPPRILIGSTRAPLIYTPIAFPGWGNYKSYAESFNETQRVGINTYDPDYTLDVKGEIGTDSLTVGNWDGLFKVDHTNNRIGIGTNTPTTDLQMYKTGSNATIRLQTGSDNNAYFQLYKNNSQVGWLGTDNTRLSLVTNNLPIDFRPNNISSSTFSSTGQFNILKGLRIGNFTSHFATIDSAVVVADTLKFYVGGNAYNAILGD